MAMPYTARRYTVEEVLAFPNDGNRYELVDGELLVTPAPRYGHQDVLGRLYVQVARYLEAYPEFHVMFSPADITWEGESLVQPDLFVFPMSQASEDWQAIKTLLLAVEVVSPSSARGDRLVKRRLYQRQGVLTYWIVDRDARLVEVWHPDDERPAIVTDTLRWHVTQDADALTIDLRQLFKDPLPG